MTLKEIPKAALMPEAVYQQLKTAILTGVFQPGQTLRQEDVAKQLGVSRGPLREALPKLEAEGMIISRPHRGARGLVGAQRNHGDIRTAGDVGGEPCEGRGPKKGSDCGPPPARDRIDDAISRGEHE